MISDYENIVNLSILDVINRTETLVSTGRRDAAIELYETWINHGESHLKYVASFNLGVLYVAVHNRERAIVTYERALEWNPHFIQARLNLGTLLEQVGRQNDALEQWRQALLSPEITKPENMSLRLHALNNLGRLLEIQRQFKSALDMLEQSLELDSTQYDVMLHQVHLAQKICRWPIYGPLKGMTVEELVGGTSPLAMLAASDDPAQQLAASLRFVHHKFSAPRHEPLAPSGGYGHDRIRIGYLSSNLSMHAVSLLTVELFERHDRNRFEVYGFCWSHEDGTVFRERVVSAFDHFIRIGSQGDKEAAECIRTYEIDILVDLQGMTSGARPLILSYRPAPLQVTYLGFPGPTGLPWIDYVIADRYMIPEEETCHYTEKPLYLPNCFQVSDSKREVGPLPRRADYSLPDDAFVFCTFNNNYKYTPEMFELWMSILRRVPNSVLWLLADNEWAKDNLSKAAMDHGIAVDRLNFAPRAVPTEYLARYQLADLFLDTYPFNGGTTANDALFMGLPLLTRSGRTFASRYAGSLLTALKVPELITTSSAGYEEQAVHLATHPDELGVMKRKIKDNAANVYDMTHVVKDLEWMLARALGYGHDCSVTSRSFDADTIVPSAKLPSRAAIKRDVIVNFNSLTSWGISEPVKFEYHMGEVIKLLPSGHYFGDNLLAWGRNNSLFDDSAFVASWTKNLTAHADKAIAWRRYILVCAACHCLHLPGDFVECGVFQGTGVKTVIDYFGPAEFNRTFWGYDTFEGSIVMANSTAGQNFAAVSDRFRGYEQVRLIQGMLPESLEGNTPASISYLHIDLNSSVSEVTLLEKLFDRVVSGGMVILNDFEWAGASRNQKIEVDAWLEQRDYRVFPLPTGQGMVVKR